jgi:hypothetical protein
MRYGAETEAARHPPDPNLGCYRKPRLQKRKRRAAKHISVAQRSTNL